MKFLIIRINIAPEFLPQIFFQLERSYAGLKAQKESRDDWFH